jgi:hypothetical protein
METTFQILEIILAVYKKNGYTNLSPIAEGLNCTINTKGTYLLKFDGIQFDELHTPYGSIRLCGRSSPVIEIEKELFSHFKGRFLTPNNRHFLITHIRNNPIQYPIVRSTVASIDEIYDYLYLPQQECMNWNMTRAFYDSEIQRLVMSGWLTDDLCVLKELTEDASLMNYERLIEMMCNLNTYEDFRVIEFRKTMKPEKYIHILSLIILSGTLFQTH